jgi:hypothetical protein
VFLGHALTKEGWMVRTLFIVYCFHLKCMLKPWELCLHYRMLNKVVPVMRRAFADSKSCAWFVCFLESIVHTPCVQLAQLQFISIVGWSNLLWLQKKELAGWAIFVSSVNHSIHLTTIFTDAKSFFLILSHLFVSTAKHQSLFPTLSHFKNQ